MNPVGLINAPTKAEYGKLYLPNKGVYPNLGIHSLYSFLFANGIDIGYENVLDGEVTSFEEISHIIKSKHFELIGFYANVSNYNSTKVLCQLVKQKNESTVVILGGPLPTTSPLAILENNEFVDGIVSGDGEDALLSIIQCDSLYIDTPGLYYKKDGAVCKPKICINYTDIVHLPYPLQHIPNLDKYTAYSAEYFNNETIATATYFHKTGCDQNCAFCCVPAIGKMGRNRTPQQAWEEVQFLHSAFGVNHIYEVSDNILNVGKEPTWFTEFSDLSGKYNSNQKVRFRIYASTNRIDSLFIKRFLQIGGDTLSVGFESACDEELYFAKNKCTTMEMNRNALKLIKDNNLKLVAFFMLGLPFTSVNSTVKTLDFIKEVLDYKNVVFVLAALTTPLPQTALWTKYIVNNPDLSEKYHISSGKLVEPTWESEQIAKDFIDYTPDVQVDYEFLKQIQYEIYRYRPDVFSSWSPENFDKFSG